MKSFIVTAAFLLLGVLIACNRNSESKDVALENLKEKISVNETGKSEYYQSDSVVTTDQKQKKR